MYDSFFAYTSHASRVFIVGAHARKLLRSYVHHGMSSATEFEHLLDAVSQYQPALTPLLQLIRDEGHTTECPALWKDLLECLSSASPVCGLLHFDPVLFELLDKILSGYDCSQSVESLVYIQEHLPVLASIVCKVGCPDVIKPIIKELIIKAKSPYFQGKPHITGMCDTDCKCDGQDLSFFPQWPKLAHRGSYVLDSKQADSHQKCTKRGSSHPTLTPGLFVMSCTHGNTQANMPSTMGS